MNAYLNVVKTISPTKICNYIRQRGWTELPDLRGGKVKQYLYPNTGFVILIPLDTTFTDYLNVLYDSIETISKVERSSIISVLSNIMNPAADILKWRIINNKTILGQIPLDLMEDYISKISYCVASTCLDVLNPKSYHNKIHTKEVNKEISKCSVGQTEFGSYIINLICPLGNYQYEVFNEPDLPLMRKINIQLMDSIACINKSVQDNSSELDEKVDQGIMSVNFLDSISDFIEEHSTTSLKIHIVRSPSVPDSDITEHTQTIERKIYQKVVDIADKYRPQEEKNVIKTLFGKISDIAGNPDPESREFVSIILVVIGDDYREQRVKVRLSSSYYQEISNAFENGYTVKVRGKYTANGKNKTMDEVALSIEQ